MIETVESRLKKLEKGHKPGVSKPVFKAYLVEADDTGKVWRTNVATGRRRRIAGKTVGIEPWKPPEDILALASRREPAPAPPEIPKVVVENVEEEQRQDDMAEFMRKWESLR